MPRARREDFAGAWHHVMNRGARRAHVFADDADGLRFLDALAEMVDRFNLEGHAYSLMPNHHHLLVHSAHGNLSEGMQFLHGTYTQFLNKRHRFSRSRG